MNDTENNDDVVAVTGRPNDIPIEDPQPAPLGGNSTFAERARAAGKVKTKQVDDDTEGAENKAVTTAATKAPKSRKPSK